MKRPVSFDQDRCCTESPDCGHRAYLRGGSVNVEGVDGMWHVRFASGAIVYATPSVSYAETVAMALRKMIEAGWTITRHETAEGST